MSLEGFRQFVGKVGCKWFDTSLQIIPDDKVHRYRLADDKPGKMNGAYKVKEEADGFCVGWCRDWKVGETHTYMSSAGARSNAEQRREIQRRRKEAQAAREREAAEALSATRERAARLWNASDEADPFHPYLIRKGIQSGPARSGRGLLMVPVFVDGVLSSIQYITDEGEKRFLKGEGGTRGGYCEWAGDDSTVYVCEGFATGGSIHQATGSLTVVAFNAANLVPVVQHVMSTYPNSRVVICADNDHNGDQEEITAKSNPGRYWAGQAAAKAGGLPVVFPDIAGDFNDLHAAQGLEEVKAALNVVPFIETEYPEIHMDHYPGYDDAPQPPEPDVSPYDLMEQTIRPLGFDDEMYSFLPRCTGQIISLRAGELSSGSGMLMLADLDDWRVIFGDYELDHTKVAKMAQPLIMKMCRKKGIYDPDIVRGAGAWPEGKAAVINLGEELYICSEGRSIPHNDMTGREVYERSKRAYNLDFPPLRNAEANKLRKICDKLNWKNRMSGALLSGWIVIAPIGGALPWRPHIFLTGGKGSGKSTVINDIIHPMLNMCAVKMDGGSTEAGLRSSIGSGSRPVIMDEFEGESKRDAEKVDAILNWARKASSGGVVVNANGSYRARSCVCFAAINPLISKDADVERNTKLELVRNSSPRAARDYSELLDMLHDTISEEYQHRMIRRTIDNIDALLHNCQVFIRHASQRLGSKRAGDQIGTLLAGAYMLNSTAKVTDEVAAEYINAQDWSWHDEDTEGGDTDSLMQNILTAMVDYSTHDRTGKMPVSDLIERVLAGGTGSDDAKRALGRYGLAVIDGYLRVANKSNRLSELLAGTVYQVYKPTLNRSPGSRKGEHPFRFSTGVTSRYVEIPLEGLIEGYRMPDEENPF